MQYSVVNYKKILVEDESIRFDADFYMPDFLKNAVLLKEKNAEKLDDLCTKKRITKGETPLWQGFSYEETGVPFVRSQNLVFGSIKNDDFVFVSEKYHKLKKRSEIQKGDSLIAIVGATIGVIGFYDLNEPANSNQAVAIVRLDNQTFSKYIQVFLHSEIAQKQIKRFQGGNARDNLDLDEVRKIKVILPSGIFNSAIEQIFDKAKERIDHSKALYSQAEQLLLSELGLSDWKPKHKLAFVKNFSDTKDAERFDAEYFQPKYEEIIKAVKKYKDGFDELGNLVKIKDKNFTPKDNEQYKYIELANISSNGEINGYSENFGNELPSRARRKVQKGDLIVSSIEGSLESIALITEDWKNALCSTGFFAINSEKINSETLLLLLKTQVWQLQLKKGCKGTILTAIGKDELSKIVLPKIKPETQKQIKEKISEMYETKKTSKSLLEIAKRGVEMAIEKDEQEAEKWIENKLKELKIEI